VADRDRPGPVSDPDRRSSVSAPDPDPDPPPALKSPLPAPKRPALYPRPAPKTVAAEKAKKAYESWQALKDSPNLRRDLIDELRADYEKAKAAADAEARHNAEALARWREEVAAWEEREDARRRGEAAERRRRQQAAEGRRLAEEAAAEAGRAREEVEAARRREEEYDADGLVLLRKSVRLVRRDGRVEVTGTVINRRRRALRHVQITLFLFGGPRVPGQPRPDAGVARARGTNLGPGERWDFKAVGKAVGKGPPETYHVYRLEGL
jgi:hypothetical protein